MKNTHKITIAGVDLTLNSENSEEYVQKLALELTRKINSIALSSSGVTKLQAAVVCALDLLDENYRLKLLIEDGKKK
ncbi:MAG: hypothetical protein DBY04_02810 [Clostridiales bacterium]|nr:MAG: hypothetical protein DBY04_02810 [Clostridiales bacterium]